MQKSTAEWKKYQINSIYRYSLGWRMEKSWLGRLFFSLSPAALLIKNAKMPRSFYGSLFAFENSTTIAGEFFVAVYSFSIAQSFFFLEKNRFGV
jgi:hypothetical protein